MPIPNSDENPTQKENKPWRKRQDTEIVSLSGTPSGVRKEQDLYQGIAFSYQGMAFCIRTSRFVSGHRFSDAVSRLSTLPLQGLLAMKLDFRGLFGVPTT
jgi:hypothetical protein